MTSAWRLSWARLQTRVTPFRKLATSLGKARGGRRRDPGPKYPDPVAAVRWSTTVLAARLPWCRNCLAQAVAAKRFLDREGVRNTLHLGVAVEPESGHLAAHAWLEADGRVLLGDSAESFEIIYSQS